MFCLIVTVLRHSLYSLYTIIRVSFIPKKLLRHPSSPLNKANIFLNFLILIKCFILTNHYIILMLHNLLMKI